MIYVDTSVALAQLLSETRVPPPAFWTERLVSSRLLAYECWSRVHALGLGETHGEALRTLLAHLMVLELSPHALEHAERPLPAPVRTLDALHLASIHFLTAKGLPVKLATYDTRMAEAARLLGVGLYPL